jgi:hypothetical protein
VVRHRVDADPAPTFYFDADADPDPAYPKFYMLVNYKFFGLLFTALPVFSIYDSLFKFSEEV